MAVIDRIEEGVRLNATDYRVLAQAQRDVAELGRVRTSTEIHGSAHRQRGHMLMSLRNLEKLGFVARRERDWSSGTVTTRGRAYLATYEPPAKKHGRTPNGGLSPDGGTRFANMLVALDAGPILSLGAQNPKLGGIVTKGRHKGLPMRAVTLEEGRTCPTACQLRDRCYGGNMPGSKRILWTGDETGTAIAQAIAKSPKPLMVRLHTLGDFVSIKYAREMLAALKASGSAAFGYTHWGPETTIGYAIRTWAKQNWDVFSIRTSYLAGSRDPIAERSAVIVSHPDEAKAHNAIVCPEQLGQVGSCAECGYCWHGTRPVAFLDHEQLSKMKREAPAAAPLQVAA